MRHKAAQVFALAVQAACGFVFGLVVLNLYGTEAFAVYGAIVGICSPVFILLSLNLPRLAVVLDDDVLDRLAGVFNTACGGAALLAVLMSVSFVGAGWAVALGVAMKFHADAMQKMALSRLYRTEDYRLAVLRTAAKVCGLLIVIGAVSVLPVPLEVALLAYGAASYLGCGQAAALFRLHLPRLSADKGFLQEGGWGTLVNFILSVFLQFPKYVFVATSDIAALAEYTLKLNFVSSVGVFVRNLLNVILRGLKTGPSLAGTLRIIGGTLTVIGALNVVMGLVYWILLSRQIIVIDVQVGPFVAFAIALSVTNAVLGLVSMLFLVEGWKKWETGLLLAVLGAAVATGQIIGLGFDQVHVLWPAAQAICAALLLALWRQWRSA